jgi:hypothetical protein
MVALLTTITSLGLLIAHGCNIVGADFKAPRAARVEGVVNEPALMYVELRVERVLLVART